MRFVRQKIKKPRKNLEANNIMEYLNIYGFVMILSISDFS